MDKVKAKQDKLLAQELQSALDYQAGYDVATGKGGQDHKPRYPLIYEAGHVAGSKEAKAQAKRREQQKKDIKKRLAQ